MNSTSIQAIGKRKQKPCMILTEQNYISVILIKRRFESEFFYEDAKNEPFHLKLMTSRKTEVYMFKFLCIINNIGAGFIIEVAPIFQLHILVDLYTLC